jgi:molybdenum cofactor guanylyltransferase
MTKNSLYPGGSQPSLHGLVLAGGRSSRLGRDKGALEYHGVPQARWALGLLEPFCAQSFVSVRREQAAASAYRDLSLMVDEGDSAGPASGVLTALRRFPGAAWLVVAADMPLLNPPLLAGLVARRDPAALATAYRHHDGTPEPLCAIWEPAARVRLEEDGDGGSLRRLLEGGPARLLEVENDTVLVSVNTQADDERVRRLLGAGAAVLM